MAPQTGTRCATLPAPGTLEGGGPARCADGDPVPMQVALVVDDEPSVRALVAAVLRRRGWAVIEAADGHAALEVAPDELGLLVTDFQMPILSGAALTRALRQRQQRLPVVMVSGTPEARTHMAGMLGPRTAIMDKPFLVEELVARVAAVTA